jgi:hypothetical protein
VSERWSTIVRVDSATRLYPRILKAREQQALQLVRETPGITLGEVQAVLDLSDAGMRRLTSGMRGQVRFEQPPLSVPAELEPEVTWRPGPPRDVLVARATEEARERALASIVEPRFAGHLATYRMALDAVDELHQRIADRTDLDLMGTSRWAATWQLAGRTLGFARAHLILAEAGIADEAMPTARGVHEASRMLEVVSNVHEADMALRWLADDDERYPKPHEVRAAIERFEQMMNDMLVAEGEEPLPTTRHLSAELYRRMSGATHNRRYALTSVVEPHLRRMVRGRHPNFYGRAVAITYAGSIVNEAISQAGLFLASSFLGEVGSAEWLQTVLRPTLETLKAADVDYPLDFASIDAAARAAYAS